MKTSDETVGNVAKIAALWPQCVTERLGKDGKPELAIDFDKLRAELSSEVLDESEERYQFTWPDKRAASRLANTPSDMTLRPCVEESVGKDGTSGGFDSENLYIEGDNLEVLKLLREDYLGKVKMIYIDPPYNTGNDFVYNDDFAISGSEFEERGAVRDEDGNLVIDPMQRNTESNGRFHTDWLNMIYPRLKVARDLLAEDGIIFISIDENEIQNMRKVCEEIFGEANFISQLGWQKVYSPKNQARHFSNDYEFVVCYAKNIDSFNINLLPRTEAMNARYKNPDNDQRGPWKPGDCVGSGVRKNGYYDVVSPKTGKVFNVPQGKHWVYAPDNMMNMIADNRIWFGVDGNAFPSVKQFLSDVSGRRPSSLLMYEDYGHTDMAKKEVIKLFPELEKAPFDTPKPIKLIKMLSIIGSNENDIILDFFSGSATTAHSIFELNAEEQTKRKFILVQLPEPLEDNDEAVAMGLHNLCEVGKERIRRAGRKVKEEAGLQGQDLDIGFRVLKLDSSNMEDVFYTPEDFDSNNLFTMVDNVKEGRTAEDLLFQIMPELNIPLSAKIEVREINGKKVFVVDDGYLVATFDKEVNTDTVKVMAQMKPQYFVMRDASAESDNVLDDFDQIFRHYSPDTVRKIL